MAKPDHEDPRPRKRRQVKSELNVRLLVGTLIAVAVLGPAGYFWHEFQVRRTAGAMLSRTDALEKEEKWGEAAAYLYRYLQLRPDDVDARIRLTETFDKSDQDGRLKPRTIDLYYRALGVAPAERQTELRNRLTDLLLEMRRFQAADSEAEKMLQTKAEDPQGLRVRALAHYGLFRLGSRTANSQGHVSIAEEFEKALEQDPHNVELVGTLARIYRNEPQLLNQEKWADSEDKQAEQAKYADDLIDRMVEAKAEESTAYLARYLYLQQYQPADAGEDLDKALELSPDHLHALLLAAEHSRREALRILSEKGSADDEAKKDAEQRLAKAGEHYDHIIKVVAPHGEKAYLEQAYSEQAHLGLGEIYLLRGDADKAVQTLRRGLKDGNSGGIDLNRRLAEVLIDLGRVESAEDALKDLSAAVDKRVATLPRPMRLSLERSISMLRGRCFAAKGELRKAIVELKRVLASRASSDAEVRQTLQAEMLLGNIYASLNEWDLAAAAFERAATLEPTLAQPRLAAATAWARFNRPEMAIRHYEMALSLEGTSSAANASRQAVTGVQRLEALYDLARARFQRQKRLPEAARNWAPFRKAISGARATDGQASLPNAWRADLLQADYLVVIGEEKGDRRQGVRDAAEQLRQAEQRHPTSESLFLKLVLGYEGLEAPADADRAMEKLESLAGKSAATYLLRSRLHFWRQEYDKAREILRNGLEALPPEDHGALNQALVEIDLKAGGFEMSRSQLLDLHKKDETNAALIRQLLERAFEQNNFPEVEDWELKLRDLNHPESSRYADYSKVRRLLAQATGQQDSKFVEGIELLADLERRLPNSPRIRILRGRVLEIQGEPRQAINAYQEAIRLGMQTVSGYERLISLLGNEKRFDEAGTYLAKAKQRGLSSKKLATLEIAVAAGAGQLDDAEGFARSVAAQDAENALAQLNYARLLAANEKPEEAKAAFQEAIRRAPADLRTYLSLFSFYVGTKDNDQARQTLQELKENVDLPGGQLAAVLADSYERLGDVEKADAAYREAQGLDPENGANGIRLADFLTRHGNSDEAETILRRIMVEHPGSNAARYRLADILVARGGREEWEEAFQLLEQSGGDENVSNLDRRLQALLLIRRAGRENLKDATEILEALVLDIEEPADADRLLLAQVYEADIARLEGEDDEDSAEKKLQAAQEQYLAVVGQANPNPSHLALFVEFLIRNDQAGAASGYLDRIESLMPDNLATMRLRALWLHNQDRTDDVKPLVEKLAEKLLEKIDDDPRLEAQLALRVGKIYFDVELLGEAERWYRRLVELEPNGYVRLVSALAGQGRMQDVIDVCTQAAQSDHSAQPASLLATILVSEKAGQEKFQQAEPILSKALEDHSEDADLLFSVANMRLFLEQVDEADKLYQRVLELRPRHLAALNNRATLLSEMPQRSEEALELIDRAIELAGEQAALLDTKGMIFVYGGKPEQAVQFLKTAAYSANSDPRYHFHLAVAYLRGGDLKKARNAHEEAKGRDLEGQFLTEMDLQLLTELEEKFPD